MGRRRNYVTEEQAIEHPDTKTIITYYKLESCLDKELAVLTTRINDKYGIKATKEQATSIYEEFDFIGILLSYYQLSFREASIVDKAFKRLLLKSYCEE